MTLIEKIKSKTSRRNRLKGQISTLIGVSCATILSAGIVLNPVGIIALTIGSIMFGKEAINRALKTEDETETEIEN